MSRGFPTPRTGLAWFPWPAAGGPLGLAGPCVDGGVACGRLRHRRVRHRRRRGETAARCAAPPRQAPHSRRPEVSARRAGQAALAISPSAAAYAVACADLVAASSLTKAVGAWRHLRPPEAASKKAVLAAAALPGSTPAAGAQSSAARGADSAMAAAKAGPSARAVAPSRPAARAAATRVSTAPRRVSAGVVMS